MPKEGERPRNSLFCVVGVAVAIAKLNLNERQGEQQTRLFSRTTCTHTHEQVGSERNTRMTSALSRAIAKNTNKLPPPPLAPKRAGRARERERVEGPTLSLARGAAILGKKAVARNPLQVVAQLDVRLVNWAHHKSA